LTSINGKPNVLGGKRSGFRKGSATGCDTEVVRSDDAAEDGPNWDEIHGFKSPGEYARFVEWLNEALDEGALVEIDVAERYSGSSI
jgi:hypothetical protein